MKKMKLCRECGFSYGLARTAVWNSSGTITERTDPDGRLMLMESDTYTELFQRLEEYLGISIKRIVFEAQRIASTCSIDSVMRGPLKAVRRVPGGKRVMVEIFCRLSFWLGEGYARTICYRPGKLGRAILRNSYDRELMASTILGAFEALERKPYEHTWERLGDDEVICVRPAAEGSEMAQRLTFTPPRPKPGKRILDCCSRCGAPLALSYLEWREERGEVIDSRTGYRMVFLPLYVAHVVFRELEVELGKDIYPVIEEAQRELSLRNIRAEFIETGMAGATVRRDVLYREVLDSLPLRGLGNPVEYEAHDGRLSITLENPYNEYLIAGHLRALYELGEGRSAAASWEFVDPSTMKLEISAE